MASFLLGLLGFPDPKQRVLDIAHVPRISHSTLPSKNIIKTYNDVDEKCERFFSVCFETIWFRQRGPDQGGLPRASQRYRGGAAED